MRILKTILLFAALPLLGAMTEDVRVLETVTVTSEYTGQPVDEREAQALWPMSEDPLWKTLGACEVKLDGKTYAYSIKMTPEVRALEGKPVTIAGFILPLEAEERFSHFLLSLRTPTCPYCPPGSPNEIIEVFTTEPTGWDEGLVTVNGTMKFTSDSEKGIFFQLKDAAIKR